MYRRPVIEELWARFFAALQPLHVGGKLGAVLFQFPHWITAVPKAMRHVEHCAERMHPFVTAFEFRHESWFSEKHRESTLAMERERGIVHVILDAPEGMTKRAHSVWEATSPELAIVRLHGRDASTWSGAESAAERFNHDDSDDELRELAPPIEDIAGRTARTHVLFNNCYRDIEAAEPVIGDVTINHEQPAQYKRTSKVASFQQSGSADAQPLPPLHDVELSWMGPNGFVLTGIEFIGDIAYARSWWCPAAACLGARSVILFHAGMKRPRRGRALFVCLRVDNLGAWGHSWIVAHPCAATFTDRMQLNFDLADS
ncbi:hypothetical protein OKW36_001934 [Paraburkholderia sp. MM5482-R1]